MRYGNGEDVRVGDRIELWADLLGRVVCVIDTDQFTLRFPASEWSYLKIGAMIETDNGNLFHYPELDENFRLLSRG